MAHPNSLKNLRKGGGPGRPRGEGMAAYIKAKCGDDGRAVIDLLYQIANDKKMPGAVRVAASTALLDRGFGRPTQQIAVSPAEIPRFFIDCIPSMTPDFPAENSSESAH